MKVALIIGLIFSFNSRAQVNQKQNNRKIERLEKRLDRNSKKTFEFLDSPDCAYLNEKMKSTITTSDKMLGFLNSNVKTIFPNKSKMIISTVFELRNDPESTLEFMVFDNLITIDLNVKLTYQDGTIVNLPFIGRYSSGEELYIYHSTIYEKNNFPADQKNGVLGLGMPKGAWSEKADSYEQKLPLPIEPQYYQKHFNGEKVVNHNPLSQDFWCARHNKKFDRLNDQWSRLEQRLSNLNSQKVFEIQTAGIASCK